MQAPETELVIVIIMTGFKKNLQTGDYDTTINIIGGLRDCSVIYKAIDSYFNETDTFQDLIANRNEFNLRTELQKLNKLWHKEFTLIKAELDKVGTNNTSLSIASGYKEDKQAFLTFMKEIFKGSSLLRDNLSGNCY